MIRIRADVLSQVVEEARHDPATECCGLLAGRDAVITAIFPARNALASPVAFEIAPEELFRLFRRMRAMGLEHLGIYHSHSTGENFPSARDIERAFYPDAAYLIVSLQPGAAQPVRAFTIRDGNVSELAIERLEQEKRAG